MPDTQASLPQEVNDFLEKHPDTQAVDCIFPDLSGVVRGKRYPIEFIEKIYNGGLAFPGSVFLLAANGESMDPLGMGFSDGDPDEIARPIPGSLVPVPWAQRPTAQLNLTLVTADGEAYYFEPRNVLARVLERFKELKLKPVVAFELEFYLIDRDRLENEAPQPPISPLTGVRDRATQVYGMNELESFGPFLADAEDACREQGIITSAMSAEYAPGQFEINLLHTDDALLAADQCFMFKRAVKGVASRHGFQATFMAKPYLDQAGNGLHLHCSLLNEAGENVFALEEDKGKDGISQTLRNALGGVTATLPEAMAFLAPNLNSFRRFQPDIFVPLRVCWGHENRSVALRVPTGKPEARRIEHRVAGADANPYLALASFLAGVHYGLTCEIDCGAPFEGNAGAEPDGKLPLRPRRSLERLRQGEILKDYFGDKYVETFAACKELEFDAFDQVISPAEYTWYLQAD